MMEMECKLTDKNIDRVIQDGESGYDLGCQEGALVDVTREDDDENKLLKDTVDNLKLTYLQHMHYLNINLRKCISAPNP